MVWCHERTFLMFVEGIKIMLEPRQNTTIRESNNTNSFWGSAGHEEVTCMPTVPFGGHESYHRTPWRLSRGLPPHHRAPHKSWCRSMRARYGRHFPRSPFFHASLLLLWDVNLRCGLQHSSFESFNTIGSQCINAPKLLNIAIFSFQADQSLELLCWTCCV